MTFQNHQPPVTQPLSSKVAIEIDDPIGIHMTPLQLGGSKAISNSGDWLTSGERITFTNGNDHDRKIADMEFERAQLQLFIALCKASTVKSWYSAGAVGIVQHVLLGKLFCTFPYQCCWDHSLLIIATRYSIIAAVC